ncbi:MAG: hypothetical protein AB1486_16600 [Planctomycetota bacterium]
MLERTRLRVKDVDFDRHQIAIRQVKGGKDRFVPLPRSIEQDLRQHLSRVRHACQRLAGAHPRHR